MEKLFYPNSIAIIGLSGKPDNIPRLVLENLIRWKYKGRIFGVNPRSEDEHVDGIRMYKHINELPIVPDLVYSLIPARHVPETIEACGRFGITRMAIPSGGFNEHGAEGAGLAEKVIECAQKYNIKFVGPNCITIANTANGLCLPFVPSYPLPKGGLSIITQSGGVGLMLWNLMLEENIGMAKFASIGNKLSLDEVDFLRYFGQDPETKIICMYLESVPRGKELLEAVKKVDRPIIILKSSISSKGKKAAMSHTAAISNDDDVLNAAFERANVIRIDAFSDLIEVAKAFELPPMRGNRIMLMSPAGGFNVIMADLCEKYKFTFADPGETFYQELNQFSNAGVINFSNPLDMGDIYDPDMYAHIFYEIMHNDNVDGAIYVSQWPDMPKGDDVFFKMFHTDLSKETTGTILSSGKPLGVCLFGLSKSMFRIKRNLSFPIFNRTDELVMALKKQADYYRKKAEPLPEFKIQDTVPMEKAKTWINNHSGELGEEAYELLKLFSINIPANHIAKNPDEAVDWAEKIGYPVVLKVNSPDALHKTDVGGVITGLNAHGEVNFAFNKIKSNLLLHNKNASFLGVRVIKMAEDGIDMFIGGKQDESFGPVVFFGFGGIYVEVFHDTKCALCPSYPKEIEEKIYQLKSYKIVQGTRGRPPVDIKKYVSLIETISYIMAEFPEIKELDLNPVRIVHANSLPVPLDIRMKIEK